ncbi:MAG TPA: MFS transporter [Candidatus Methanoperedens sp.]
METSLKNEKLFTKNFVLTSLSTLVLFTSFYFLLVTLPIYISNELAGSDFEVGLSLFVFTISAVFLRPFMGQEVNRRGRKNILVAGMLVFLAAMLLYNYATSIPLLLLLRAFHGLGWGAATTAATTLIADIAPLSRRGEAMGIFGMAANIAMAISPPVSMFLLNSTNYEILFIAGAAIALVSLLLVLPISETVVVHTKTPLFSMEALSPSTMMFIISLTYGSIVAFLPLFAQKQNMTNPGIFFAVLAVSLIIVRALAGRISDIKGRKFVIVPGMILIILGLWVLSQADSIWYFLAAALLYGLGFGSVHPALIAFLVDSVGEKERGAAMGTFTAAFDLGIAAGSLIMGIVLESLGFGVMYFLGGLIVLAGTVWFIFWTGKNMREI